MTACNAIKTQGSTGYTALSEEKTPVNVFSVSIGYNSYSVEHIINASGQHTIKWAEPIGPSHLPPGEMNLYTFPTAVCEGSTRLLDGAELEDLKTVLVSLGTDPGCEMFNTPDAVGALPIHALLVSNSPEAVALSMEIFRGLPSMLSRAHCEGPFVGENTLHVLAVNQREDEFVELLKLATDRLTREECKSVFTTQAVGIFFDASPMHLYGGTPLAYAATFSLKQAVLTLLNTGLVSLNGDPEDPTRPDEPMTEASACVISGFLPLHAVCANGLRHMYDWLIGEGNEPGGVEMPAALKADARIPVGDGRLAYTGGKFRMAGCSPLQLAAQLGDRKMFAFLLRKQTNILWRWGPVTKYEINLAGIDSAGEGGCDVMEIVGKLGAAKETTQLLLDEFMQGFLHKLYLDKWQLFGATIHYMQLSAHFTYIIVLLLQAFWLKEDPQRVDRTVLPPLLVFFVTLLTLFEAKLFVLWLRNHGVNRKQVRGWKLCCADKTAVADVQRWPMFMEGLKWLLLFQVDLQLISYICCLVASLCLVYESLEESAHMHERRLRVGAGSIGGSSGSVGPSADSGISWEQLPLDLGGYGHLGTHSLTLFFFAISACSKTMQIMYLMLTPFPRLGVFMLSVNRMLHNDIVIFMALFSCFIFIFYTMLYIVYPRAGPSFLPEIPSFNNWATALQAMTTLAFLGEPVEITYFEEDVPMGDLTTWQHFNLGCFLVFYVMYVLMCLILLLNLLIAMMGFTFNTVHTQATLEWRIMFARYILRLELLAAELGCFNLFAGESKEDGRHVHSFIDVIANAEGGGASGNLFHEVEAKVEVQATLNSTATSLIDGVTAEVSEGPDYRAKRFSHSSSTDLLTFHSDKVMAGPIDIQIERAIEPHFRKLASRLDAQDKLFADILASLSKMSQEEPTAAVRAYVPQRVSRRHPPAQTQTLPTPAVPRGETTRL
mmetsp:Transcript_379/g.683  ORF Transcript_379/g.683 Transcript_379/m.683 type:complete len:945 (+) Transcript_379:16-2850(+)